MKVPASSQGKKDKEFLTLAEVVHNGYLVATNSDACRWR
jgi:hypothetical protein